MWVQSYSQLALGVMDAVSKLMMLNGTFVNLLKSVKDGSICRPALMPNPKNKTAPTTAWFTNTIGTGPAMQFYWSPSMHFTSMDSEIVPMFVDHTDPGSPDPAPISFMAEGLKPYQLLTKNVKVNGKKYHFIQHGTPVGTLHYYDGKFSKLAAPNHC